MFPKRHFLTKPLICFVSLLPIRVFYRRLNSPLPSIYSDCSIVVFIYLFVYCCICERDSSIIGAAFSSQAALCVRLSSHLPFYARTCGPFPPPTASGGCYNDKAFNCAQKRRKSDLKSIFSSPPPSFFFLVL